MIRTWADVTTVWTDIVRHPMPSIPVHVHPAVARVKAGAEMDVLGPTGSQYSDAEREAVVSAFLRTPGSKEDIVQIVCDGTRHKPGTAFRTVKAQRSPTGSWPAARGPSAASYGPPTG